MCIRDREMGFAGIPGVPDRSQDIAGPDFLPDAHGCRSVLEVGVRAERAVAMVEDHVIADDGAVPGQLSTEGLERHHVDQAGPGVPGAMVTLAVMGSDHGAGARCQDRLPEAWELLGLGLSPLPAGGAFAGRV